MAPGTKVVSNEPLTISIPNNGTYAIGDEVKVGGGVVHDPSSDASVKPLKLGTVTVPASCARHEVFLAGPSRP